MARATLAPVIGRPASCSQKIVWRYSSSATVASAMPLIVSPSAERLHAPLRQLHERARGGREMGVAACDERERLVDRRIERARCRAGACSRGRSGWTASRPCRRARAPRDPARPSGTRPRSAGSIVTPAACARSRSWRRVGSIAAQRASARISGARASRSIVTGSLDALGVRRRCRAAPRAPRRGRRGPRPRPAARSAPASSSPSRTASATSAVFWPTTRMRTPG